MMIYLFKSTSKSRQFISFCRHAISVYIFSLILSLSLLSFSPLSALMLLLCNSVVPFCVCFLFVRIRPKSIQKYILLFFRCFSIAFFFGFINIFSHHHFPLATRFASVVVLIFQLGFNWIVSHRRHCWRFKTDDKRTRKRQKKMILMEKMCTVWMVKVCPSELWNCVEWSTKQVFLSLCHSLPSASCVCVSMA